MISFSRVMKKAFVEGALMGVGRSYGLTDEQRDALIKEHGLKEDANILLRNAGRGAIAEQLAVPFAGPLASLGARVGGRIGGLPGTFIGAVGGAAIPLLGASYLATNKYSPEAADEIIARNREKSE